MRRQLYAGFLVLVSLSVVQCGGDTAPLGDPYTAFSGETPITITGFSEDSMEPFLSPDGLTLFFNNSNDPRVNTDLFHATRTGPASFASRGRLPPANSPGLDGVPSVDREGNFFFVSTRNYEATRSSLYRGRFAGGTLSGVELVPGVSRLEFGILNFDAEISADGQTLWFVDGRFTGGPVPKSAAIVIAQRQGEGFVRHPGSAGMLAQVNRGGLNFAPAISADGRELFFTRLSSRLAILRATRPSVEAAFGMPQPVAAVTGHVEAPALSADGRELYFHKRVDGRFRIYRVSR